MLTTLHNNKYALIASALVLPAVAFELIGVSKFALPGNPAYAWFAGNLGYPQISPVARALEFVVVIGPVIALLLRSSRLFDLKCERSIRVSSVPSPSRASYGTLRLSPSALSSWQSWERTLFLKIGNVSSA